jgi:hypothetical protein
MKYLVNISGGSGSTVALGRVIERYGKDNVDAVFADTRSEHPSLYRLLDETEQAFGIQIKRLGDGRDVWSVFNEHRVFKVGVGGCKAAVELKHKPLDAYRAKHYTPENCTVILGMDWMEPERMERAAARIAPYPVLFPLTWPKRMAKCEEIAELTRYGITIPDLYSRGHSHNNCAGACILAGQAQWAGLLQDDPERFEMYAKREEQWREKTGKDFSILNDRRGGGSRRSMTLFELKSRILAGEQFREWRSTCNCMGYEPDRSEQKAIEDVA